MMIALFKLSPGGKRNTSTFQNEDGHQICFSCGHVANRKWCGAQKMTEFCIKSEILYIYHIGTDKCLKPNTKKYRLQVKEAVLRYIGLGAHNIQQAELGEAVATGDIQEA